MIRYLGVIEAASCPEHGPIHVAKHIELPKADPFACPICGRLLERSRIVAVDDLLSDEAIARAAAVWCTPKAAYSPTFVRDIVEAVVGTPTTNDLQCPGCGTIYAEAEIGDDCQHCGYRAIGYTRVSNEQQ